MAIRPHVTMHMVSSIDARIVVNDTWPKHLNVTQVYEGVHAKLAGDAWIVGRKTMAEFIESEPLPVEASSPVCRTTYKAAVSASGAFAVAIDAKGKLNMNMSSANGDALIMVLTESVSDDHLAELQRDGISYIFAGKNEIDLKAALDGLATEFGVKRLLLEGGGGVNGSFLEAGLIDEISLLVLPVADGSTGVPTLFDRAPSAAQALKLESSEVLDNGILHLRYSVVS